MLKSRTFCIFARIVALYFDAQVIQCHDDHNQVHSQEGPPTVNCLISIHIVHRRVRCTLYLVRCLPRLEATTIETSLSLSPEKKASLPTTSSLSHSSTSCPLPPSFRTSSLLHWQSMSPNRSLSARQRCILVRIQNTTWTPRLCPMKSSCASIHLKHCLHPQVNWCLSNLNIQENVDVPLQFLISRAPTLPLLRPSVCPCPISP